MWTYFYKLIQLSVNYSIVFLSKIFSNGYLLNNMHDLNLLNNTFASFFLYFNIFLKYFFV